MKIDWKESSIIGLAVIVLFMILLSPTNITSETSIEQKLTDNGWELYTISDCPACQLQKELFQNIDELTIIVCDIDRDKCMKEKITHVPTWINTKTNEVRVGYQELSQIKIMIE